MFRENVTVSRGTVQGGGLTRIGSHSLFMTVRAHRARLHRWQPHYFCNGATLAGHVTVEDYATVGAFSSGAPILPRWVAMLMSARSTVITQDVPPFSRWSLERETRSYGVNAIGLERHGFVRERIQLIERAFRLLLRSKLNTSQALERCVQPRKAPADVAELIALYRIGRTRPGQVAKRVALPCANFRG